MHLSKVHHLAAFIGSFALTIAFDGQGSRGEVVVRTLNGQMSEAVSFLITSKCLGKGEKRARRFPTRLELRV